MTDVTGLDKVTGQDFFFFMSAVLLSTIILLFLLSSAVSLSYFNLSVSMRECLGKYSCMSSFHISYSHTEWNLLSSGTNTLFCGDEPAIKQLTTNKTHQWLHPVSCRCRNVDQTLVMKKYLQLFLEQAKGSYFKQKT